MRVRKGKKGWAGWTPVSADEERKFKELCLCPEGSRSWCDANEVSGLEALQARLEGVAVEVKSTALTFRNKNKFMVPEEIRELASVAAQCRDLVKRGRRYRKRAENSMPEWGPRGKVVKKPVVTKLWVNGRATEDREEWCEEVRLHCEKCYDDKSETSEKQAERIRGQRCRGDSAVALQGRRVQITVNRVLRARGKMLRGKFNGPADSLVVEMLSRLPTEVNALVSEAFSKGLQSSRGLAHYGLGVPQEA